MNKLIMISLALTVTIISLGQTEEIKYFKDEELQKEVNAEKGKFSKAIIRNTDGSITTEIKNTKNNKIVSSETYKGQEPFGIWKFSYRNDLDYSFDLNYSDVYCEDNTPELKNFLENNDSLNYIAPTLEGEITISQFLTKNMVYPPIAVENNIMGKVSIGFTLTEKGKVENVVILKGTNILLDKEAVRIIRELKFTNPPVINGQAKEICVILPISFKLM